MDRLPKQYKHPSFSNMRECENPEEFSPQCAIGLPSLFTQDTYPPTHTPDECTSLWGTCHSTTSLTSSRLCACGRGAGYQFKVHVRVAIIPCKAKLVVRWSVVPPLASGLLFRIPI